MVIHECGQISVVGLQSGIYPPSACGEQDGSFGFAHGVSATGGTGSYSFILKDHNGDILPMEEYGGWENLGAGDYHLTIIDENGCQGEEEFTIEGEDIEVSYGASPECEYSANGYIWAYAYAPASGSSTQTYHYEWSTGDEFESSEGILLEGLSAGTYIVTVSTENGACTYTETIVVEGLVSEAPLSVEAEVINTCPQYPSGHIELQVSGGVPRLNSTHFSYSIQWEDYNSLYNQRRYDLEAGNYTVTVTDLCGNTITDSECVYHVDYEVAELIYSYTTGNGTEDKCWTTETCGSHSRTFYSGITNWERPEGECRIRIDCGNGSWWFSPTGEIHYVYSGILINDATDEVECTRRKYCTLHWDYVTPNLATAINIDLEEEEVEVINPDPVVYYDGQCPESEGGGLKEVFQCGLGEEAVIIDIDCSQAKPPPSSPNNSRPALFQEKIRVVPNPFAEEFVIRLPDADEELARITVLDVYGRPVFEYSRALRNGETLVSLRGFPAGIYYLTVKAKEAEYRSLVVKTH
ncbi:MAG: T9SS type A sorting domain-containing protein [Lewinellaceae bacterium]|nr:T9SS type A sorting domain-containing protein [Lewinellaceae bacterium]MCB9289872.1 T9SS type A sorting domain-containing protein [Lewinellaceae bacterium]